MQAEKLIKITNSPYYWPGVAATAVVVGVATGLAVERISSKIKSPSKEALEDGWWEGTFESDDEASPKYAEPIPDFPDIPTGINERRWDPDADRIVNDELFMKPDISRLVDYTKYQNLAEEYNEELGNEGKFVMPDDEDAPEPYDDDRFELIDEKEFVDGVGNGDGFVTATGTYFTQEKILAGWNEDLTEKDISNTVGWRAIHMFDSPDVGAVYVRNIQLKVLYEVVRCDDPFEQVLQESVKMVLDKVQEE